MKETKEGRSGGHDTAAPKASKGNWRKTYAGVLFCTVAIATIGAGLLAGAAINFLREKKPMHKGTTAPESKRDQLTILCIDEGQLVLSDRTALLESAGYRVLPAADVNAAMQLFVNHEIDLVLTNDHLRGVSGAELSIFMKQVKPVRIVLLSNSAQIPTNLLNHLDACMEQDCSPEGLLLCLRRVLPKELPVEAICLVRCAS